MKPDILSLEKNYDWQYLELPFDFINGILCKLFYRCLFDICLLTSGFPTVTGRIELEHLTEMG